MVFNLSLNFKTVFKGRLVLLLQKQNLSHFFTVHVHGRQSYKHFGQSVKYNKTYVCFHHCYSIIVGISGRQMIFNHII